MKGEKLAPAAQGAVLSFLLTLGALGAMVTGLKLNVENFVGLALLWAAVCVAAAVLSSLRFGGWALLVCAAGSVLYLLRSEACWEQTLDMLCKITNYYDNAYGWGFLRGPNMGRGPMGRPLAVLGLWIALANCRQLVRGKGSWFPLLLGSVPLMACVVVTDTVPESRYLYLWLLALALILLSRGLRREQARWGVNVVRLAAVPTALALALLFWAAPREGYDKQPRELEEQLTHWFQSLPDRFEKMGDEVVSALDGTVQPETVRLDTLGPRIDRVYPVMEVTAPVSGSVYLRGQHYDIYTGTGWTVSEDSREHFEGPETIRTLGLITITTRNIRDVVYLPYYPAAGEMLTEGSLENADREKSYTYQQLGLYTHWRDVVETLAQTQGGSHICRENAKIANLDLPEDTRNWAEEILKDILSGEDTATAVADAIAAYVRGSARYDLDTQRMPRDSGDFARWFLEESDTGYCVHFATATVVLLRAAGVEARYVEGYLFTARMGEETTVTADQAHAWVEYYEPLLQSWIPLEATPADLGDDPQPQETAQTQPEQPEQTQQPTQAQTQPSQGVENPVTPDTPGEPEKEREQADLSGLWRVLKGLFLPVLAVLTAEGQRRLRVHRREVLRRRGSPNRRALALWRELEGLHRLLKTEPPEEARATALKAKYSPHTISREELQTLETARRAALAEMNNRPWYHKFLDRYVFAAY